MKKGMTAVCSVILMITLTGCQKEYGQEIAKRYQGIQGYDATVSLKVGEAEYQLSQTFQAPDTYRTEVLTPRNLKGTVSLVTSDEITFSGGEFPSVTMPRGLSESADYMQVKDFFTAYYDETPGSMEVTEDGILLTHTDANRGTQKLWLNQKTLMPEQMQVFNQEGTMVFQIEYLEFKATKE